MEDFFQYSITPSLQYSDADIFLISINIINAKFAD